MDEHLQERLGAGSPQRLLQGEVELLLLLQIFHNKSMRREEAPSFTTLKQREFE